MRHAKAGRRLGRKTSHRIAMFRNMVTSFFDHERITTTDAKAKELRSIAEKLITLGKRGDLHARRLAASYIRDPKTVAKLFSQIAPRYQERNGGYTRIVKLGLRHGDNAALSIIELVEEAFVKKVSKKPLKTAAVTSMPATVAAVDAPASPGVSGETQAVEPQTVETAPAAEVTKEEEVPKTTVAEDEKCEAAAD